MDHLTEQNNNKNSGSVTTDMGVNFFANNDKLVSSDEREYYDKQTQAQTEAVDNNLMRQSDPRMPLFKENKSSSSFGKGT
jgi:hypothetical protein